MFKADLPIQSLKDDLLERRSFAESLGNAILNYKNNDSVVIGLFGSWGSGKTSLINMILEHIGLICKENNDIVEPIIIRFNPWSYSDQYQLLNQFFSLLSKKLKRKDYSKKAQKAGEKLKTYANFFTPLSYIPPLSPFATAFTKTMRDLGNTIKKLGELKSNDLESIKIELNELLSSQSHKILVVIDDIDRLTNLEIRQIFQLVKSLGDFKNTIYLLAFDKNIVTKALKKVQEGPGDEYLEKVVQVPFDLPMISKIELEKLLFNQLDLLIKDVPEKNWDKVHWGNIYHSGFKYFFKTIRDVTRYINSLTFSFQMVKENINPIDFIAITAIQVFLPNLYYGIRDNKDLFCASPEMDVRSGESVKKQAKERCDEIFNRIEGFDKQLVKDLLFRLFPKVQSIYGTSSYSSSFYEEWRRDCRICSPEMFEIYFRLAVPSGDISRKEIETILSFASDRNLFKETLIKLNENKKIIKFLDRLEDYTRDEIPKENIENMITVLMDIGDSFPEGSFDFWNIDTPMRILRIFYQLLHRFEEKNKRYQILKNSIEKAENSIFTIVHELSVQDQQHGRFNSKEKTEPTEKLTLEVYQLENLEEIAVNKIKMWASNGQLSKHNKLINILYRWREWSNESEVINYVANLIKEDNGLVKFITSFLYKSESYCYSDYVGKEHFMMNITEIKDFVEISEVEKRLREIYSTQEINEFEKDETLAIQTFLDIRDGKIKSRY